MTGAIVIVIAIFTGDYCPNGTNNYLSEGNICRDDTHRKIADDLRKQRFRNKLLKKTKTANKWIKYILAEPMYYFMVVTYVVGYCWVTLSFPQLKSIYKFWTGLGIHWVCGCAGLRCARVRVYVCVRYVKVRCIPGMSSWIYTRKRVYVMGLWVMNTYLFLNETKGKQQHTYHTSVLLHRTYS